MRTRRRFVKQAEFARIADIATGTVSTLCKKGLAEATVGGRIDINHPITVRYLEMRSLKAGKSSDPLAPEVAETFKSGETTTPSAIMRVHRIGWARAERLLKLARGGEEYVAAPKVKRAPKPKKPEEPKRTRRPDGLTEVPEVNPEEIEAYENAEPADEIVDMPDNIVAYADMTLRELIIRFGSDSQFLDWLNSTQKVEQIHEKRLKNAQTEGALVSREAVQRGIIEPVDSAHIKLMTDGAKTIALRAQAMFAVGKDVREVELKISERIASFIKPLRGKADKVLKNL